MAKKQEKPPKRRTQLRDLPAKEKTLAAEEQRRVKGGADAFDTTSDARGLAIGTRVIVRG
ncbi:MAG TPA: hypothetical protein VGV38_22020 [Pyrinomonadaceae bacterium]|nr:hypothetical protein [Pyrinomonadaceae bacterium]